MNSKLTNYIMNPNGNPYERTSLLLVDYDARKVSDRRELESQNKNLLCGKS